MEEEEKEEEVGTVTVKDFFIESSSSVTDSSFTSSTSRFTMAGRVVVRITGDLSVFDAESIVEAMVVGVNASVMESFLFLSLCCCNN